jgi:hypothetical protein
MLRLRALQTIASDNAHVFLLLPMLLMLGSLVCSAQAQSELLPGGKPILPPDALFNTPVAGLERTQATVQTVAVTGPGFDRALRVLIGERAAETNATQLTIQNTEPIAKGDALLASFSVRGTSNPGNKPAQMEFLFEKATSPWTKSVTNAVVTGSGKGVEESTRSVYLRR